MSQIDFKISKDKVVYNGITVKYSRFLEETVLETFFLLVMEYGDDLLGINAENGFEELFNEVFIESFTGISRQYKVPDPVSESFSGVLLDTIHLKNRYYIKYVTDVKRGVTELITTVSLN